MFFKSMSRAAMEAAEAAWQANEGSARQKCLAQLFMTSANTAFQRLSKEVPDERRFYAQIKTVVHLAMRDFKREHYLEVTLPDHLYFVEVRLMEPVVWFCPLSYALADSPHLRLLMEGKAPVRIESRDSPLYTSGHANWNKYVERTTKAKRFAYR